MRLLACLALLGLASVALLGLASVAHAAPTVERELFSLKLPSGWHEGKETAPTVVVVGDNDGPRVLTARFIAATKDCACIISAIVCSDAMSAEQYYAMPDRYLLSGVTVLKSTAFEEFGGHRGSGTRRLIQHPYGIASATFVFTFIENGIVCTLLSMPSAPDSAAAEKILERRLPALRALAASLTLKRATN